MIEWLIAGASLLVMGKAANDVVDAADVIGEIATNPDIPKRRKARKEAYEEYESKRVENYSRGDARIDTRIEMETEAFRAGYRERKCRDGRIRWVAPEKERNLKVRIDVRGSNDETTIDDILDRLNNKE